MTGHNIQYEEAKALSEMLKVNKTLTTLVLQSEEERREKEQKMMSDLQRIGLEKKEQKH